MVACLERTDGNAEFHQIVDFFTSSLIHYALTVSPTIYASYIKQFWTTDKSKTINDVNQIHAKVNGKTVSHTPRITKRGQDNKIPQSSGPPKKVGDEAVYTREDDRVVRVSTTVASLEAEQKSVNTSGSAEDGMEHQDDLTDFVPPAPHDSPLLGGYTPGSDEGRDESNKIEELNLSDKGSGEIEVFDYITAAEKDVNAAEPVSTAGDAVNAASVIPDVCAAGPSTSTARDIFEDEMTNIADTLMDIRSTRPRTTSVVIHNVEKEPRRATPLPTVQSQDKEFGDSYKAPLEESGKDPASESFTKKKGRIVVITTEDMQKRRNDVKARTTLLLALPDEHQLRFSKYETGKELWKVILKTFDGNEATKTKKEESVEATICSGKGEVHIASVLTASIQVSTASTDVAAASLSHDTIYAYIASKSNGSQNKYEDITQIDKDDIEEMDIKWNMALLSMRADRGKRESYKQGPKEEEPAPKALMAIDGIGWDWSYMANEEENHALIADDEVPTEFALMAKSSSSSENKVYDDSYCSKSCRKNTENLNTKISKLNEQLSDYETELYQYKIGLSQVKARLVEFKVQEIKFSEKIRGLKRDVKVRDNKIEYLINELEQFPPPPQVYSPPKKDLSWTGLPKFVDDIVTDYSRPTPSIDASKCNTSDLQSNNLFVSKHGESSGSIMSKPMIKFVKAADCPRVIKANNIENARKSTAKYAEMYRNTTKSPKVRASDCGVWVEKGKTLPKNNYAHKNVTPRAVLLKTGKTPITLSRPNMNVAQPKMTYFVKIAHSNVKRPFQGKSAVKTQPIVPRVSTVIENIPTVDLKFSTAKSTFTVDLGIKGKAVKASACWIWRPTQNTTEQGLNYNGVSVTFKKYQYIDTQGRLNNFIMAKLAFCDYHNMVAILENTEHNTDFHQIVDFLEASHIRIETTNQETKILATVDGKPRTIFESSVRRHLKLSDEEGISSLPDTKLFENLLLMGYNILPNQRFTFQKGQFSHQWKFFIHTIMQCLSPKSIGFNEFSSNIATAVVCLAANRVYNFSKMIFDGMVRNINNEPASLSRDDKQREAFPTVSSLDARQDRENINKTSALPYESSLSVTSLDANKGSVQQRLQELMKLCTSLQRQQSQMVAKIKDQDLEISGLKAMVKFLKDKDRGSAEPTQEDALIKRGIMKIGEEVGAEKSTELESNDTEEIFNVLSSMEAANILKSRVAAASVSPAAGVSTTGVPTVSGSFPTVSAIFTTASVVTPYTRRPKGITIRVPKKRKLQEQIDAQVAKEMEEEFARENQRVSEQLARDSEIARLHAEEKLKMMIEGLDRSNEVIAKHLQEYEQAKADLTIGEKIELINELNEQREFYMSVLRSHTGWKTRHFKGMALEEIKEKFIPVWKQLEDLVPMSLKEESKRVKRQGLKIDQRSSKRMKTFKDVFKEDLKGMMQLVPLEEVYVEALKLWILVKETFSIRHATKDKEKELWVELKRLFEPDFEDHLWTHNQAFMHYPLDWKLYDTCGVHHVVTITLLSKVVDPTLGRNIDLIAERKRYFAAQRTKQIRNKPLTKAQLKNKMVTYLKHMGKYTHNQLKGKSFEEIQMLYERKQKWINDFVPMDFKEVNDSEHQAKSSKKRSRADHDKESVKKQKLEEDDAEKRNLDLTRYNRSIQAGKRKVYNLISWRLFDSCGVHILLMDTGIAIHILVERKYSLVQEMLSRMLNRRLEIDHESEMAFELIRLVTAKRVKKCLDTSS
uniref:Synaptobrevin, longin-like domain protein n=1 Tax=Tanacetum cinerariifolium TaxID=118510 RepID=A0A6L2N5U0_TANCI|nr:hypothetical protein [Tanacetum cinerariifolium]